MTRTWAACAHRHCGWTEPEVETPEPNRGHYVAQLRNGAYIRETTPESRTRVKFCEVFLTKFQYSLDFLLEFSKF